MALDCSPESCHIITKMVYWSKAKYHLMIFLFLALVAMFSSELTILINLGRKHHEEHFFEIILNLDQLFRRRDNLKIFLIYSSDGLFVQCFQTTCANMVVGLMRNISVKQY